MTIDDCARRVDRCTPRARRQHARVGWNKMIHRAWGEKAINWSRWALEFAALWEAQVPDVELAQEIAEDVKRPLAFMTEIVDGGGRSGAVFGLTES